MNWLWDTIKLFAQTLRQNATLSRLAIDLTWRLLHTATDSSQPVVLVIKDFQREHCASLSPIHCEQGVVRSGMSTVGGIIEIFDSGSR